jgi:hypothetical protein
MTGIEFTPFIWAIPVAVAMLARDFTKSECETVSLKDSELRLEGDETFETSIEVTLEESQAGIHGDEVSL